MAVDLATDVWDELNGQLQGEVLDPGSEAGAAEMLGFNLVLGHAPDVVIAAESAADVQLAVRAADSAGLRVRVQGAGHGETPIVGGMLISTRRMSGVTVDPASKTATVLAGTRWADVVAQSAEHGLMPVTGSSPHVGTVGFLLGGGFGPFGRSFGVGSDYLIGAEVVTGTGEIVRTGPGENPDLLWALRGGKPHLGVIVTEATIRLRDAPLLYAGALLYDDEHIETAFRFWAKWTSTAHPELTTSAAIINLPPLEFVPEFLRNRRVLFIRFGWAGDAEEGARLAEPLRTAAPLLGDMVGPMPSTEMGRIHNDPEGPLPVWSSGRLLNNLDDDFCTEIVSEDVSGKSAAALLVEIRHLGGAQARDVPESSAVGGRGANYSLMLLAANPGRFGDAAAAMAGLTARSQRLISERSNVNWVLSGGDEELAKCWSPEVRARLESIARSYDPKGLFVR